MQVSIDLLPQRLYRLDDRLSELHLQPGQDLLGCIRLTSVLQAGNGGAQDIVEVGQGLQDDLGQTLEVLGVGEVSIVARRAVPDGFEGGSETEAERLLGFPLFSPVVPVLLGDLYSFGYGGENDTDGLEDVHFGKCR